MKAIVVGGSGQIGGWLLRVLDERGHEAVGTFATAAYPGLVHLDAADSKGSAAWLRDQRPDVVFYPAGFTWVDGCERDPERCRAANVEQPLNLARAAAEVGARFVHFSTDYVFDGREGPYREAATPNPLSEYGRAKLEAERLLTEELGEAVLVARTCWVFGPERQGKNFAYQLARTLAEGKPLACPSDQFSSPSYGPDVALASVRLAELGESGVIHVAGPEWMSRLKFARKVAFWLRLDFEQVVGRPTVELGQGAPRPLNGGLLTPRLDALLPRMISRLDDAMLDFRERLDVELDWSRGAIPERSLGHPRKVRYDVGGANGSAPTT